MSRTVRSIHSYRVYDEHSSKELSLHNIEKKAKEVSSGYVRHTATGANTKSLYDKVSNFRLTLNSNPKTGYYMPNCLKVNSIKGLDNHSRKVTAGVGNSISKKFIGLEPSINHDKSASNVNEFSDRCYIPINSKLKKKMREVFSNIKGSSNEVQFSPLQSPSKTTRSQETKTSKVTVQLINESLFKGQIIVHNDRDDILKRKEAEQKKDFKMRQAQKMVSSIKGDHIELASRKKRQATAFDQSLLCGELISTVNRLLDSGCDDTSMHGLIENEFGLNCIFNHVLFDSSVRLRRLSPKSLHHMLYIRDERFAAQKSNESKKINKTTFQGNDPKKRTQGSLSSLQL